DGEVPLRDLSEEDRRSVRAYRRVLARALDALDEEPVPDVSTAVMERIRGLDREDPVAPAGEAVRRWPEWIGWFWRPRTVSIRLRPAFAVAVAALALVLMRADGGSKGPLAAAIQPGGTVVATSRADGRVLVRFHLDAPGARSVSIVGDFTGWRSSEHLTQTAPGLWTVVVAVEPGIHEYAFVVDGDRWVQDPLAERVDDGFGGVNSRLAVLPPDGPEGA
ncbi:MAG TPA: glycogen-binding domain-containing protein, partial [Longimicrobiales bacterium]|nr:glycogen-binding domain-containing protein [Longimicrobiales bacterium]